MLHIARLGLNAGAKLWISFKLFSKQIKSEAKSPEFDATYVPIVMNQKLGKKVQNLTQHMFL